MSHQLDMFSSFAPSPPPAPATRTVLTRAYGREYEMEIREDHREPIEIEVRGIKTLIKFGFGWSTYTLDKPGAPFWSETGYRSFSAGREEHDPDTIKAMIERFIDGPKKDGNGCGGKLTRWWPRYVLQWRGSLAFELELGREDTWAQWGPEKHKECWEDHDRKQAEAIEQMRSVGIDPDDVGPPDHFKGKWPTFAQSELF